MLRPSCLEASQHVALTPPVARAPLPSCRPPPPPCPLPGCAFGPTYPLPQVVVAAGEAVGDAAVATGKFLWAGGQVVGHAVEDAAKATAHVVTLGACAVM